LVTAPISIGAYFFPLIDKNPQAMPAPRISAMISQISKLLAVKKY
jgi:hypothetical protein